MADNSGPAFPLADSSIDLENSNLSGANGITRREYFAAKAMAALIASGSDAPMRGYDGWRNEMAREAYRYADAMLAERKEGER